MSDPDREDYLNGLERDANRALSTGDHTTAIDLATEAIDFLGAEPDTDHEAVFTWRAFRGRALTDARRWFDAEREFLALLHERTEHESLTSRAVLRVRGNLARAVALSGRVAEGIDIAERLLDDRRRLLGEDHPETLDSYGHLAHFHHLAGDHEASADRYRDLLERRRRVLGEDHPITEQTRVNLAAVAARVPTIDAIEELRQRADTCRERDGDDAPSTITAEAHLSRALLRAGHHDEALTVARRVQFARERMSGSNDIGVLTARHTVARALMATGATHEGFRELIALSIAMPLDINEPHDFAVGIVSDIIEYAFMITDSGDDLNIIEYSWAERCWRTLRQAQGNIPADHPAHEVLSEYEGFLDSTPD